VIRRNLSLSALALACAAGAHAQSSVTLFGIVDLNVQHFNATGKQTLNALGNGGLSTSRLGFRGIEDLGGGLHAGFWLEGSLNPDTGTGRANNVNNQPSGAVPAGAFLFDRNAYVDLGGSWGELRLGHDFVPTHWNSIYFDPFNANGVARAGNFSFAGVTTAPLPSAITASNSISYWLPHGLGGFYGVAMVALGENAANAANTANRNDGDLKGLRLGWANRKFDIAAAVSHTDYAPTATIGNYTHANIGASYDAGFAKFFALYNRVKVEVLNGPVRKNLWEIGAHVPVTPATKLRFTYARLDDTSNATLVNANGTPRSGNDAHMWGIGFVHELSKRTALYGTYADIRNQGQGTYGVSGGLAPTPGGHSGGLELGLRHSF
jgi:predicted porin